MNIQFIYQLVEFKCVFLRQHDFNDSDISIIQCQSSNACRILGIILWTVLIESYIHLPQYTQCL